MALSHFADRSRRPSDKALEHILGATYRFWQDIQEMVADQVPGLVREWGFTSSTTGWGLRLKKNKRVLLYLTPRDAHFLASTALGEKAIAVARQRRLPKAFLKVLDAAPAYAEGRGVRLAVRREADVRDVEKLITLKLEA